MSNEHDQRDSLDTARAAMRLRLNQEFRSLHKRRRRRRVAAAFLAPAALIAGLMLWNWSGWKQQADAILPAEQLATAPATVPPVKKSALENPPQFVESKTPSRSPKAADFQYIEYIELKPGDLPKWLTEAKSDLIVYQVSGRTEVVSERELLAASSKKRKPRVN